MAENSPHPSGQSPNVTQTGALVDCAAGSAFGLLLGLLIGLSMSTVVASVVSALVVVMAGFFGLSEKITNTPPLNIARRLGSFSLVASIAVLAAIWMRTHGTLSPPMAEQLAISGATPEMKQEIVRRQGSALYSINAETCAKIADTVGASTDSIALRLGALDNVKGLLDDIDEFGQADNREPILKSAYFYLCLRK